MARGNIETFADNVPVPKADNTGTEAYEQLGRHVEASYAAGANALKQSAEAKAQAGADWGGVARDVGSLIKNAGDVINQHLEQVDAANLTSGFADIETGTASDIEKAKTTMDPHDPDVVKNFMASRQEALENLKSNIKTDSGMKMYDQMSSQYNVNTYNKVLGYQTEAASADVINKISGAGKTYANLAQSDPASAGNYAAQIDAMAPSLPAEQRPKIVSELKQQIYDSAGEGVLGKIMNNPNATPADVQTARALLNDPKGAYASNMSSGQFVSVNNRLDKLTETLGATSGVIAAQRLSAGYDQMKTNGGIDPGNQWQTTINNYQGASPKETQEWKADQQMKFDDARAFGAATKTINDMPSPQVESTLLDLQNSVKNASAADAPRLEAQLKAATEASASRDKAFKENPATWVISNNEVVGARYQQFVANQTPANFQAYAVASVAEQRRLYPTETPKVVSGEMETTMGQTIKAGLQSKEGPGAAASALSTYANLSGGYWPQIATQLRKDKIIPAGAGVAAELYGDPKTQALGETVIQATSLPPEQLAAKFNITREKALVAASKALQPLMKTLGNVPNSDQILDDYREALTATVQYTGTTPTSTGDVTALANKMIAGRYDIEGDTLRVPKSAGVDAGRVGDGASEVLGDMGNHKLVPPPHFSEMGITADRYAAQIKSTGKWYANENGTGAVLYDEDMHTVKEIVNGKPRDVEMSWAALGQAADKGILRSTVKAAAGVVDKIGGQ